MSARDSSGVSEWTMYIAGGRIESIRRIVCTVLEAAGACIIIADDMRASSSCLCLTEHHHPDTKHTPPTPTSHHPLPPSTTLYHQLHTHCLRLLSSSLQASSTPQLSSSLSHSARRRITFPTRRNTTLAIATHLATARRDRLNCKRRTEAAHRHRNARPHIRRRSGRLPV
jgi:hypothetical protein